MKQRRVLAAILAGVLLTGLTACGGGSAPAKETSAAAAAAAAPETKAPEIKAPETKAPETKAAEMKAPETKAPETTAPEKAALPMEGDYTLFAVQNEGYLVASETMDMSSVITLKEGGTGSMTMDEDAMDITSWKEENGTVQIVMADGGEAPAKVTDGILELDIYGTGDMLLYFAQAEADTSGFQLMTLDEVLEKMAAEEAGQAGGNPKLAGVLESLDVTKGAHLIYSRDVEAQNAVQDFDVTAKDGVFYSSRTTKVGGAVETMITVIKDGKVYNLYPDKKTGAAVTESSSVLDENVMMMDDLYQDLFFKAGEAEYTEETREVDGISYDAVVYPAGEYSPEIAFLFDGDGNLAYCQKGAPVAEGAADTGEILCRIFSIDDQVDESLFDISGYKIE